MPYKELKINEIPEDTLLMSVKDAAKWLGISKSHFYFLVDTGKLPAGYRVSERCVRWRVDEIQEFVQKLAAR